MGFKDAGKSHYLGHRERLRRRFRDAGADALPDYELLELILFRAAARRDAKPLAKALLARFGTFAEALNAPEELLREVPGTAITELKLVRAAALRLMRGAGAPAAVILVPGTRLLPRLDGLRDQGAVPYAIVHSNFLLALLVLTKHVPHTSPTRPSCLVL
jgi:hypothetical protein